MDLSRSTVGMLPPWSRYTISVVLPHSTNSLFSSTTWHRSITVARVGDWVSFSAIRTYFRPLLEQRRSGLVSKLKWPYQLGMCCHVTTEHKMHHHTNWICGSWESLCTRIILVIFGTQEMERLIEGIKAIFFTNLIQSGIQTKSWNTSPTSICTEEVRLGNNFASSVCAFWDGCLNFAMMRMIPSLSTLSETGASATEAMRSCDKNILKLLTRAVLPLSPGPSYILHSRTNGRALACRYAEDTCIMYGVCMLQTALSWYSPPIPV